MSDALHAALGPGREFDLVRALVARWGPRAQGIGDDAAILSLTAGAHLVASTDATVEDVHFRRAWIGPREVGYRAAAAALSDLAAMGARPIGVLVALSFPDAWSAHIEAVGDGIGEAAALAGAPIVGGNITGGEHLAITITVLGETARPLRRDAAREGHLIYVTGRLGGPGRALSCWLAGREPDAASRERFARPVARIREGEWLAAHGAQAAIDVSDGVAADLRHLAAASGVRIELDLAAVPCMPGVTPREAVASGEEYELVVTASAPLDVKSFAETFGVWLTAIGRVVRMTDAGASVTAIEDGAFVDLPRGHDHLSS